MALEILFWTRARAADMGEPLYPQGPFASEPQHGKRAVKIFGTYGTNSMHRWRSPLVAQIAGLPNDKAERKKIIDNVLDLLQVKCSERGV